MIRLPLLATPSQSFECVLNAQNCTITLKTRDYDGVPRLYCNLAVNKTLIWGDVLCLHMVGIKLYRYLPFTGNLVFVDMAAQDPPLWSGLDDRWRLVYLTPEEEMLYLPKMRLGSEIMADLAAAGVGV